MRDQDLPQNQLLWQLENLNHEIREIGEYLKLEALTEEESLRLGSGLKLDLNRPIHELFYEVYSSTLERNLPYFPTLKVQTRSFDLLQRSQYCSDKHKSETRFLRETGFLASRLSLNRAVLPAELLEYRAKTITLSIS